MGYPKFGLTLAQATDEARRCNIEKGWRPAEGGPGENSFGDYAALLVEEIGEMVSAYRKHRLTDVTGPARCANLRCTNYGSTCLGRDNCPTEHARLPKPQGVGAEMADIFIRLVDMADVFGIDLEAEYRRKMAHNWTREIRHGGTMAGPAVAVGDPAGVTRRRYNSLWMTIPTDPRGWWTGEEVGEFVEQWDRLGLPRLTMQEAGVERLTLWCTDVPRAAKMVDMSYGTGEGYGFEIAKGEYSVGIVQAEKGDRDGRA